jgi:hypothetical protein
LVEPTSPSVTANRCSPLANWSFSPRSTTVSLHCRITLSCCLTVWLPLHI